MGGTQNFVHNSIAKNLLDITNTLKYTYTHRLQFSVIRQLLGLQQQQQLLLRLLLLLLLRHRRSSVVKLVM